LKPSDTKVQTNGGMGARPNTPPRGKITPGNKFN